ncbi:MAG: hypothetical protein WA047_06655 [Phenylobacterium sp.]|uniref:hypothetical protein n=1 Tax=Phenylobacterium sp. TaxID=1871053 RepID=UPI003BB5CB29
MDAKNPDHIPERFRDIVEKREGYHLTLAEVVDGGWSLHFRCKRCSGGSGFTSEEIVERFGKHLLVTLGQLSERSVCKSHNCRGRGFWPVMGVGSDPSSEVNGREQRFECWQARDIRMRRLLHKHGLDLAIADHCWLTAMEHSGDHPNFLPRAPAMPDAPLSAAAVAGDVPDRCDRNRVRWP